MPLILSCHLSLSLIFLNQSFTSFAQFLYRPFRLPAVLVGDGRLGGISATISAYESLRIRGYDVVAVVFEDHGLLNEEPLMAYFRNRYLQLFLLSMPEDSSFIH